MHGSGSNQLSSALTWQAQAMLIHIAILNLELSVRSQN